MGWLEGLLTGYVDRSHEIEKQKMEEAIRSRETEGKVYQSLLNANDPKLREMAGVGMLDMANPLRKSKGMRGFLGDVERSPMLPLIRKYMQTPQQYEETTLAQGLPSRQVTGYQLPPGQQSQQAGISATLDEAAELPPTAKTDTNTNFPRPGAPYHPGYIPEPPPTPPAAQTTASPTQAGAPPITAPQPMPPPSPPSARRDLSEAGVVSPISPMQFGEQNEYEPGKAFRTAEARPAPPLPTPPPPPPMAQGQATFRDVPPEVREETTTRTGYPQFPSSSDLAIAARRAQMTGDFQALTDIFVQSGVPRAEAMQQAADEIIAMHQAGGRGSLPFQSIEIEFTDETGKIQKTLGSYDKRTRRYTDSQGNPIRGNITRAIPASALGGGAALNRAMYEYHVTPLDLRNDPALAVQVNQRAAQIAAEQAYAVTGAQGEARFNNPLTIPQAQETHLPVGTRGPQVFGQNIPTAQQADRRIALNTMVSWMDTIDKALDVLPKQGELGSYVPGAMIAIQRNLPEYREAYAVLDSSINQILAALSRTVQQNVGTQTELDARRAMETLGVIQGNLLKPTQGDTQESARARIEVTKTYLRDMLTRLPGTPTPTVTPPPQPPPAAVPGGGAGAPTPQPTPTPTPTPTPQVPTPAAPLGAGPPNPPAGWNQGLYQSPPPPTGDGKTYFNGKEI